jgi:hypothetical protein
MLSENNHRPWSIAMTWHDLLFMHWPVPAASLRKIVPHSLEIDTYEGQAWIGVVPFHMTGIRHRLLPVIPGLSAFPELNVRTYVQAKNEKPGVLFFSLDAAHSIAVFTARHTYQLAYYRARMSVDHRDGWIHYRSRRRYRGPAPAEFEAKYRPTGEVFQSQPGSLEHWFTERYRLYTTDKQQLLRYADIHHVPWPLQPAEAELRENTMIAPLGIALPDTAPILHYAKRLDVIAWPLSVGS